MEAPARRDTTTPFAERQIAELQEEIRRVGRCYEGPIHQLCLVYILGLILAIVLAAVHREATMVAFYSFLTVGSATMLGTVL